MAQPQKSVWVKFVAKFSTKELKKGEKQTNRNVKALKSLGKAAAVAATAVAVAIAAMTKQTLKQGDAMAKNARTLGITVEQYELLAVIAEEAGLATKTLGNGFKFMFKELGKGKNMSIEFERSLQDGGLDAEVLKKFRNDIPGLIKYINNQLSGLDQVTRDSVLGVLLSRLGKEFPKLTNAGIDAATSGFERSGGSQFGGGRAQ